MFKKFLSVFILFSCFWGTVFAAPKKSPSYEPIEIDYIKQKEGSITVVVNPAVELLFIAARLAGYPTFTRYYGTDYLEQIDVLFEKYKESDFVKKLVEFRNKGLSDYGIIELASYLKADFSGTTVPFKPVPQEMKYFWHSTNSNELNNLVKMLHDFAKQTNFPRIYILNRGSYLNFVGYTLENMKQEKVLEWAGNYFAFGEVDPVTINATQLCGYAYVNCIKNNGVTERRMYLPSDSYTATYVYAFSMLYSTEMAYNIWPEIKDNMTKYAIDYVIKYENVKPEDTKKFQYNPMLFSEYFYCFPFFDFVKFSDPEMYESEVAAAKKELLFDEFDEVMEIMNNYSANRDKYPNFISLSPEVIEIANKMKVN